MRAEPSYGRASSKNGLVTQIEETSAGPMHLPWPGQMVRAGDQTLHLRRAQSTRESAEPAVLVHGLGGSATNWTDLMGLLRDDLDCWAPDLPGFGWSPPAVHHPRGHTLAAHARAVIDLIEGSVAAPVHLMGNSLGGSIATILAASRPDLVRSLTLVSPALPVRRPRASNAHLPALALPWVGQRLARRLGRFPVEQRVRATFALCFADPTQITAQRFDEALAEASRRAHLAYDSEAMLGSLRGLLSAYLRRGPASLWSIAARVQAPTLLVYGERDRLVDPRTSTRATRTFSNSSLLLLPGSGHVAQMEQPAEVARAIRRHLARAS